MGEKSGANLRIIVVAAGLAVLGACATPPPSPPPPPPPPPVKAVTIPPRPQPPGGATELMAIPPVGADGIRQTVNANISDNQRTWNLRSGLNVAALNCLRPEHVALVGNYRELLKKHSRELSRTNSALGSEYRKRYGSGYRNDQDAYMTRVYNYFALPPALPKFCDAALTVSNDLRAVPVGQLGAFSVTALPRLEAVFENFYRSYEQYRVNLAAWDAAYGVPAAGASPFGPSTSSLEAQYPRSTISSVPVGPSQAYGTADSSASTMHQPVDMGAQPQFGPEASDVLESNGDKGGVRFTSQPVVQLDPDG